jgi:hypothetical protein
VRWEEKQVFGSEASHRGKGWQTVAFMRRVVFAVSLFVPSVVIVVFFSGCW